MQVERYECDACGAVQLVEADGEVFGLRGDVFEVCRAGGSGGAFYACSRSCLLDAVRAVLDGRNE